MPEICENWLSFVDRYIYYAHQMYEIYQILPYSVDFIAPRGKLWIALNKPILIRNGVLFGIKDL